MKAVAAAEASLLGSSDEEGRWGGRTKNATKPKRGYGSCHADHLGDSCVYPERIFCSRFGIPRRMFWRIHEDLVKDKLQYWGTRQVVGNRAGISSTAKIMVRLRIIRTGNLFDSMDNGMRRVKETV